MRRAKNSKIMDSLQLQEDNGSAAQDLSLEGDRQFVTALARGLEVLRCFKPGEQQLGNQEIAERTGIPRSTVSRLTYTLTRLGYLRYLEKHGNYSLGTGILSLGYALLAHNNILKIARPLMRELAEYSQAAVSVGARDRLNMIYLESCRSSSMVTLRLEAGSQIALATTAMGRAYLCGLPEMERNEVLDNLQVYFGSDWPEIEAGIEQALLEYQDFGFCTSLGVWRKDVYAVAVPMQPVGGSDLLSFNCGGPAFLMNAQTLREDIGPRLINLVRAVAMEAERF